MSHPCERNLFLPTTHHHFGQCPLGHYDFIIYLMPHNLNPLIVLPTYSIYFRQITTRPWKQNRLASHFNHRTIYAPTWLCQKIGMTTPLQSTFPRERHNFDSIKPPFSSIIHPNLPTSDSFIIIYHHIISPCSIPFTSPNPSSSPIYFTPHPSPGLQDPSKEDPRAELPALQIWQQQILSTVKHPWFRRGCVAVDL